ncbi:hypothetical protein BO78DRAFT_82647 [Aspergillus sclerotiicarbonarius CBS 121057]|uniref:Uncharacterized protein n=1 Tax=Aspergillus sclerotiicarbonarius (strain CBS 121057 / IBT 28362) TaxID=1448318 RepID=A0A319FJJ8_ASPSB|nr:hypothetical protein BO78DRAFT_82647 [Aspergillus sclerotiicarbonarius CBS 121057]
MCPCTVSKGETLADLSQNPAMTSILTVLFIPDRVGQRCLQELKSNNSKSKKKKKKKKKKKPKTAKESKQNKPQED